MMWRWIERIFGVLAGLSGPVFVILVSVHTYHTTQCVNTKCTTTTTSDWMLNPLQTIAIAFITLVTGAMLAGFIWAQSATESRGMLIAMWVSVPIFAFFVYGAAFTVIGSVAFFYAAGTLFAAIFGTIAQALSGRKRNTSHEVLSPG